MASPFAYELGVFDPTFPGITLHYPNEATLQKASEVADLRHRLIVQDLLRRNPEMSVTDATPARVEEQLFQNPDIGIHLSPEEKDAIGRKFIAYDPDNAVANLAIASAFQHERRHFHDWLLSPYTAEINTIRSEVFVNYIRVRMALDADGTTVIPVPLPRWLRKSEADRQALVDMWQSLLGDTVRIQLPDLRHPEVTAVIDVITRRYRSIGMLFERFDPHAGTQLAGTQIDGAALFEASALQIQIQAIHDLFGETAKNLFYEAMQAPESPIRYAFFPKAMAMAMLLHRPGETAESGILSFENDTLSTIATWCLLGSNAADSANAHPLTRLEHAFRCVVERGLSSLDRPASEILDELDSFSGTMPYRDLLRHSIAQGDRIVERMENMVDDYRRGSDFLRGIVQAQRFLHTLHAYMARLFMHDPDGYCQPTDYLDRSLGKLPEPPVRHTFGRPFCSVNRSMLDRFDKVKLFNDASTPGEVFLQQTIRQAPNGGVIDLQIADNWQYLCGLADLLFSEYNRDHPEIEAQRALAKENGIRYLEVLS